jgi:sensor histidine kinase YesM
VILRSFEKEFNLNKVVSESKSNFTIKKKELSSLYFYQEKKILLLYFINRQWTVPSILFLVASPLGVISVTNHRRRLHRWLSIGDSTFMHSTHTDQPKQIQTILSISQLPRHQNQHLKTQTSKPPAKHCITPSLPSLSLPKTRSPSPLVTDLDQMESSQSFITKNRN